MTTHCPGCPFKGCDDCRYQGAKPVALQGNLTATRYTEGVSTETAPAGASTPVGPGPRPSDRKD